MAHGVYPLLNVADLDRSLAFYKGLGLRASMTSMPMGETTMRWVTVTAGEDHALRIFQRDFEGADPEDVAWASGEVGKGVLLNIGVPNARRAYEKAKALGVAKGVALEPNPWGGSAFMLADPDGYYLMITDRFPDAEPRRPAKRAATKRKPAKAAKKSAKKRVGKKAK